MDRDAITGILNQPAALMDDLSWFPAAMLAVGMDAGEEEEDEDEEGEGAQGPKSINDMTFAQLAKVRSCGVRPHVEAACFVGSNDVPVASSCM